MNHTRKPNILFFLTDQHRLSACGAYGDTPCQTPNIDRLAAEGVRFENTYCSTPLCSPARASLMTGQYAHLHGMTNNNYSLGCTLNEIEDHPHVLPRRLQEAGYDTGYNGKWHLGTDHFPDHIFTPDVRRPRGMPRDLGFEGWDYEGHGAGGWGYKDFTDYLESNGLRHGVTTFQSPRSGPIEWAGLLDGGVEATVSYYLAENTIRLMTDFAGRDKPFFMWHNDWGPHTPYWVPREYYERYRDVNIPEWPNYRWDSRGIVGPHWANIYPTADRMIWDDWAELIRYYYASTTLIDEQFGRIMDALETSGALDHTIVIFSADHGESLGDHGGIHNKGFTHFEETLRVPLIVRFPDGTGAGTVRTELMSSIDIYASILDITGATQADKPVHGQSFMPLIEGRDVPWRDYVVTEFNGLQDLLFIQRTIRKGSLKYGYNLFLKDELYDLERDPHEMNNLIDAPGYQEPLRELRRCLAEWMRETRDQAIAGYTQIHGKM